MCRVDRFGTVSRMVQGPGLWLLGFWVSCVGSTDSEPCRECAARWSRRCTPSPASLVSGFGVWGLRAMFFRAWHVLGFGVRGSDFGSGVSQIEGFGLETCVSGWISGCGSKVSNLGFRVQGFGLRVSSWKHCEGLGLIVQSLGLGV